MDLSKVIILFGFMALYFVCAYAAYLNFDNIGLVCYVVATIALAVGASYIAWQKTHKNK